MKDNASKFPSPESGIINSFVIGSAQKKAGDCFRPLSRGLSIPSLTASSCGERIKRFRPLSRGLSIPSSLFSTTSRKRLSFRPLSRGLSIPSHLPPSSGDLG